MMRNTYMEPQMGSVRLQLYAPPTVKRIQEIAVPSRNDLRNSDTERAKVVSGHPLIVDVQNVAGVR